MNKILFLLLFVFIFSLNSLYAQTNHWETAVFPQSSWKYFVGTSAPPDNWYESSFNDQSWSTATGGFGYGDLKSGTTIPQTLSIFLRIKFSVTDTSDFTESYLHLDYDDAFVAYINGTEIARSPGLFDVHPAYNKESAFEHESNMYNGGNPDAFHFTKNKMASFIKNGENLLCIQVHNNSITSSDLIAIPYLSFGIKSTQKYYEPTPSTLIILFDSSNLPIIKIGTKGQTIPNDPKIYADLGIINNFGRRNNFTDPYSDYFGKIAIETRGSSSQMFPKKSYGFETLDSLLIEDSKKLLGFPKESDWILYAPYSDKTLLRNVLTYRIASQFGRYAPRTKFCELFINDEYRGVYVFTEKIKHDNNRVDIATLKPTDLAGDSLTGGYILKIDRGYDGSNGFISNYLSNDIQIKFVFVYPKPEEIKLQQRNYIQNYVKNFEDALYLSYFDPVNGYPKYIDVASFVDHFIINEFTKNVDAYRLSAYMYKDKDSKGGKLVAGPVWDYDLTLGNANYYTGQFTYGWVYNSIPIKEENPPPFWWKKLATDPGFQNKLKCRWTELRKNVLNLDSINKFIDSQTTVLDEAQRRNFSKYLILGQYIWPNYNISTSYEGEVQYLKNWIASRLLWLDNNMPGTGPCVTAVNPIISDNAWITVSPNPFFEEVDFAIATQKTGKVEISILNVNGRRIASISRQNYGDDMIHIYWDGKDASGNNLSSGIYLYTITIGGEMIKTGKLVKTE